MNIFTSLIGIIFVLPRLVLIIYYLFFRFFLNPVPSFLYLILGFLFAPYTLFWYCAMYNWFPYQWSSWQIFVLIVMVLIDLSSTTSNLQELFRTK